MNFNAAQVGRHMLYFVVNNQPSHVVIVDVLAQAQPGTGTKGVVPIGGQNSKGIVPLRGQNQYTTTGQTTTTSNGQTTTITSNGVTTTTPNGQTTTSTPSGILSHPTAARLQRPPMEPELLLHPVTAEYTKIRD
jgi:hypothetical protein